MTEWPDLRRAFARAVARRGVRCAAQDLGYTPKGVYKILRGETKKPREAVIRWAKEQAEAERAKQ